MQPLKFKFVEEEDRKELAAVGVAAFFSMNLASVLDLFLGQIEFPEKRIVRKKRWFTHFLK